MTVFAPSKFAPPTPAAHHVARDELLARLDLPGPVLRVVTGSPGSGKTTLLAEWFRSRPARSVCWLRVDDADHDPVRFWSAVVASVRTLHQEFGTGCLDLLTLAPLVDHDFLECLLGAGGTLAAPVDVVLDDFHLVGRDVHDQFRFLLARGPGGLGFTIGTRVEPEIGLDRLRLAGQLAEVREADLRFDETAARALLHHLHADVSGEGFRAVMERTEGWAAGLHLTALALRAHEDPQAFVAGFAGSVQPIAAYLWSEVYGAQSPQVQRFLLDTCVVDELTPGLAAALSPDNPVTLFDIEAANLLLRRVGPQADTFRYHQLLVDLLRLRLRSSDPEHEYRLHERAARWHDEQHDPDAAFRHRWRARRRTEALRSMHGTVLDVEYLSLPTLSTAERTLTDDDLHAAPGPALSFATALFANGFIAEAERLVSRVNRLARHRLDPEEGRQLAALGVILSLSNGDTAATVELGRLLEAPGRDSYHSPWTLLGRTMAARGHVWQGDLEGAAACLADLDDAPPTGLERLELVSTIAHLHLAAGRLTACAEALDSVRTLTDRPGSLAYTDAMLARAVLGTLRLERGDLDRAESGLRAVSDTPLAFRAPAAVLAKLALSRLWSITGHLDAAQVVIDDAYHLVRGRPPGSGILEQIRAHHVRLLIGQGRPDDAAAVAADLGDTVHRHRLATELAIARGAEPPEEPPEVAAAAATSLRRGLDVALARLAAALATARPAGPAADVVLDAAAGEGFVTPIVEAGAGVLAAVQDRARRRPRTPYLDRLMRTPPRVVATPLAPRAGVYVTLTDRERTVLRCLATSMSYGEIAAELHVSLNTVKTHTKHINQKLHTTDRRACVARARQLSYL